VEKLEGLEPPTSGCPEDRPMLSASVFGAADAEHTTAKRRAPAGSRRARTHGEPEAHRS
jgi:hypothetical protein